PAHSAYALSLHAALPIFPELLHRTAADGPALHTARSRVRSSRRRHHGADHARWRVPLDGRRSAAGGLRHPRHRLLLPARALMKEIEVIAFDADDTPDTTSGCSARPSVKGAPPAAILPPSK